MPRLHLSLGEDVASVLVNKNPLLDLGTNAAVPCRGFQGLMSKQTWYKGDLAPMVYLQLMTKLSKKIIPALFSRSKATFAMYKNKTGHTHSLNPINFQTLILSPSATYAVIPVAAEIKFAASAALLPYERCAEVIWKVRGVPHTPSP